MLRFCVYVEIVTLQFFYIRCNVYCLVGAKCNVSFDVPNSLANVLGFKRSIYSVGRHASENLVNIVNSILVHCNIIHSSYMRGTQDPVSYNFFPSAALGQMIL